MKNRNEDNVEITRNQRFLKLFVVDILHWVVNYVKSTINDWKTAEYQLSKTQQCG